MKLCQHCLDVSRADSVTVTKEFFTGLPDRARHPGLQWTKGLVCRVTLEPRTNTPCRVALHPTVPGAAARLCCVAGRVK